MDWSEFWLLTLNFYISNSWYQLNSKPVLSLCFISYILDLFMILFQTPQFQIIRHFFPVNLYQSSIFGGPFSTNSWMSTFLLSDCQILKHISKTPLYLNSFIGYFIVCRVNIALIKLKTVVQYFPKRQSTN